MVINRGGVVTGGLLLLGSLALPVAAQPGSPAGPVPVELLQARRQNLIAKLKSGVAVIRGAEELSNDPPASQYPQATAFRPDNDFFYFTGLETRDSWLVIVAQDSVRGETHLFIPARNPQEERWTGPKLGPGPEAAAHTGIPASHIHPADSVASYLRQFLTAASGGRGSGPAAGSTVWLRNTRQDREPELVQEVLALPGVTSRNLLPVLAQLRVVKDADEIRRLTRAIEITVEGHLAAMRFARPGAYEYEIEAEAEYAFRRLGAERVGYPSIVGSGFNSTVLHYDLSRRQTQPGDLIVMDMGAEFGYYTADVTRTIPVSGTFTSRQRAIYELVLGAQQAAIDAVRPGATMRDLDAVARKYLADHSGDLCGPGGCGRYFIHGLGHWIGMDVHDVGGLTPFAPGMVFTIEPFLSTGAEWVDAAGDGGGAGSGSAPTTGVSTTGGSGTF